MSLRQRMENKLREAFSPDRLNVIDESHMHAGHQPDMTGTGETHMRVQIVSEQFSGKSRVDRHRAINGLLKPELGCRAACAGHRSSGAGRTDAVLIVYSDR